VDALSDRVIMAKKGKRTEFLTRSVMMLEPLLLGMVKESTNV